MKTDQRRKGILIVMTITMVVAAVQASAATHYVSQTSPSPTPPYATLQTAAHDIQSAVDVCVDGDSVLVAPGNYTLSKQITVTNGIRLQSTAGASQTYLIGQGTWCLAISNALVVADGFTFQSGSGGVVMTGATLQNCVFTNFYDAPGAIVMSGGTVSNVIVTYFGGPGGDTISCTDTGLITDSQILAKTTSGPAGVGAGVALVNSRLQNSVVTGILSAFNGGGPAVSAVSSTVVGCVISNGYNRGQGGGAYLRDSLMDRCIVVGNRDGSGELGFGGGGIFETNSIIRDSLIVSNQAFSVSIESGFGGLGGGIYMQGGALLNCTIVENSTSESGFPGGGGGVFAESGGITNCIIYFNTISNAIASYATSSNWYNMGPAIFDHCCTAPDPGGAGNITQDPQFVMGYHLAAASPCVGTGVVQPGMIGAQDLSGIPRTHGNTVDMGAYEYRPYLSMRRSGANVAVSWPSAGSTGAILEQASSFGPPQSWVTNSSTVSDDGTNKSVTVSATSGLKLFRVYMP